MELGLRVFFEAHKLFILDVVRLLHHLADVSLYLTGRSHQCLLHFIDVLNEAVSRGHQLFLVVGLELLDHLGLILEKAEQFFLGFNHELVASFGDLLWNLVVDLDDDLVQLHLNLVKSLLGLSLLNLAFL